MKDHLLCCDWGTSSFRLQLVNIPDQQVIGGIRSMEGISDTFNAWKADGEKNNIGRHQFFLDRLKKQIKVLSDKLSTDLANITVVISGMASSSIGMEEIPYATLPFPADGSCASVRKFGAEKGFPHELLLISGVQSDSDVMRGEETQLIGLAASPRLKEYKINEATLIFPGTHSKHIFLQKGALLSFQTFMTGEVFNLMVNDSILKQSVENSNEDQYTEKELNAFKSGVRNSQTSNVLNSLFTVRTNQLFNKLDKKQNFLYLSGLLIATELIPLVSKADTHLILCSGSNLYQFYHLAFEELSLLNRTLIISKELIDKAAIAGQILIYQNELSQLKKEAI